MKHHLYSLLILFLFSLPAEVVAQQSTEPDSLTALNNTLSFYRERVNNNSFIYQGREYIGFDTRIKGHAFFLTDQWQEGSVYFKGQLYQKVPMLFDIADEEVVVKHYGGSYKIKIYKDKVDFFSFANHNFIKLDEKNAKGESILSGFYDQLYAGDLQVLAKRKKALVEYKEDMRVKEEYVQNDQYFIKKDNIFYPVKSKRSVLKVLKDQKKEIRKFLKQNYIIFNRTPEVAIVKMVQFYDQNTSKK